MIKKSIVLILFSLSLLFFACNNSKKFHDVWISDIFTFHIYYDSLGESYMISPCLVDLTDPSEAILQTVDGFEMKVKWSQTDSSFTILDNEYKIEELNKDYLFFKGVDDNDKIRDEDNIDTNSIVQAVEEEEQLFGFWRVKHTKIDYSQKEITEIFQKGLWKNRKIDTTERFSQSHIEFFDNGTAILKFVYHDTNNVGLQEECWRIEDYKGYKFLSFFSNGVIHGVIPGVYQILEIDDDYFLLEELYTDQVYYDLIKQKDKSKSSIDMPGKWISINDTNEFYVRHIPVRQIARGRVALYQDTLTLEFRDDSVSLIGSTFHHKYKYWLNSDNSIIVFEDTIKLDWYDTTVVRIMYANVIDLDSDSMRLELFDNYVYSNIKSPPGKMILNRTQNFKKIE